MKRRGTLFLAVLALVIYLIFRSVPQERQSTETPFKSPDAGSQSGEIAPKLQGVGEPQSPPVMKTFWLPFAGNISALARTEKLAIKVSDSKTVNLDVITYFDKDGRICRVEYSKNKGWKVKWTPEDTESVYKSRGETMHGLYSGPLQFTWEQLFDFLRKDVNLAAATHFNITRADYGYGSRTSSMEIFVCNVYGARGMFGQTPSDDDNCKVRFLIIPKQNRALVDDVL